MVRTYAAGLKNLSIFAGGSIVYSNFSDIKRVRAYLFLIVLLLMVLAVIAGAQDATEGTGLAAPASTTEEPSAPEEYEPLPPGFRDLRLGMTLEAVKDELERDGLFFYRGDPDVSLLRKPNQTVIETEGVTFIRKAFFQFHEKKLYIIILRLDQDTIDYYTLYTTLTAKYGPSDYLDPDQVVWENERVRMALERPLQVKYIDLDVFNERTTEQKAEESMESILRNRFLQEF